MDWSTVKVDFSQFKQDPKKPSLWANVPSLVAPTIALKSAVAVQRAEFTSTVCERLSEAELNTKTVLIATRSGTCPPYENRFVLHTARSNTVVVYNIHELEGVKRGDVNIARNKFPNAKELGIRLKWNSFDVERIAQERACRMALLNFGEVKDLELIQRVIIPSILASTERNDPQGVRSLLGYAKSWSSWAWEGSKWVLRKLMANPQLVLVAILIWTLFKVAVCIYMLPGAGVQSGLAALKILLPAESKMAELLYSGISKMATCAISVASGNVVSALYTCIVQTTKDIISGVLGASTSTAYEWISGLIFTAEAPSVGVTTMYELSQYGRLKAGAVLVQNETAQKLAHFFFGIFGNIPYVGQITKIIGANKMSAYISQHKTLIQGATEKLEIFMIVRWIYDEVQTLQQCVSGKTECCFNKGDVTTLLKAMS